MARRSLLMLQITRPAAEILMEGPAQGHVQQLQAPANPEERQPAGKRRPHQGQLPGIALRIDLPQTGFGFRPVMKGGHIAAAAEQQTAQGIKQTPGINRGQGGKQQGQRSRFLYPEAVRAGLPEPLPAVIPVHGDPDKRLWRQGAGQRTVR